MREYSLAYNLFIVTVKGSEKNDPNLRKGILDKWQKYLTAVPYKFNIFYFLIM
jgi:hypothetical protein